MWISMLPWAGYVWRWPGEGVHADRKKGKSLSETTCRLLDRGGCVEKDEVDGTQMY